MIEAQKSILKIDDKFFEGIRGHFPIFRPNEDVVYLDNASSAQKPKAVIDSIGVFYTSHYANPGRGVYDWSQRTENAIEAVREKVASFIGADKDGLVFTSGATMSLNMTAQGWGRNVLRTGDEVLFCPQDHSSMVLPWVNLQKELKDSGIDVILRPYRMKPDGGIDAAHLLSQVGPKTRLVNVTHVHNVAGVLNDIAALHAALPDHVLVNVDAAQSVSHLPVDVGSIGADFFSFSGHKMFSGNGVGVLWVSPRARDGFSPLLRGGGMAASVSRDAFYRRIEAGTQNLSAIISLGAAIDFIESIGRERIERHIHGLTIQLHRYLLRNPRIDMLFRVKEYELAQRQGIAAFRVEGFSEAEIGDYLADNGVFVRYGQHCAGEGYEYPAAPHLQNSVRVSLQIYNTEKDIENLTELLTAIGQNR